MTIWLLEFGKGKVSARKCISNVEKVTEKPHQCPKMLSKCRKGNRESQTVPENCITNAETVTEEQRKSPFRRALE
ncbi:hypothetical protein [Niallia sp.]|uniref:hypothetical protein n=1 Tax=Niallia sp. TaxID=2837523 RepID=UPI00289B4E4E|nr:hypothetical protein [Niallia sp.]